MSTKVPFQGTPQQEQRLRSEVAEIAKIKGPIMKALQLAQEIYGYLPIEVQVIVSEILKVPLEEIYGVVTFYSQFNLHPLGLYKIGVCMGTACYVKGSGDIIDRFKRELNIEPGQTTLDGMFTLEATRCIGCCGLAPVLTVGEEVFGKVVADDVTQIIAKYKTKAL